jgi:hypothetical protein
MLQSFERFIGTNSTLGTNTFQIVYIIDLQ